MTDIMLHFVEMGSGEPMILLHGNGEDHGYFEHQIEHFSKTHRVIALDTRGHGKSPLGEKEFSIKQFARDLNDFMDEMGIQKAIILGFSDGANIAMEFALEHQEKISRLILDGGNIFPTGMKPYWYSSILISYCIASVGAFFSDRYKHDLQLLRLMVKEPHIQPSELSRIHVPTLVIAGKDDMIREKHTRLIASSIPKAQLSIIDGDHFVAKNSHVCFNECVDSFIL